MPVIKKERIWIPQPDGDKLPFERVIKFTVKHKKFHVAVPIHIRGTMNSVVSLSAISLDALEENWNTLMEEYIDFIQKSVREKVLQITFRATCCVSNNDGSCILRRNDISFCRIQPAMALAYRVVYKIGNKLYDMDTRYRERLRDDHDTVIMKWTEEREQFFANAVTSMESIIVKIDKFFGALAKKPEKLESLIKNTNLIEHQ